MRVLSSSYLVWFRPDKVRADVQAYWRGAHGQIANQIPAMQEYLQHHFSCVDCGFWPVSEGVSGSIPPDWRIDGLTEVRIRSLWAGIRSMLFHMRGVARDEQNIFERVLGIMSSPLGGRWWTGPYRADVGFRTVVFIRARPEVTGMLLRHFVERELVPALLAAGAVELRSHLFLAGSHVLHRTPGVWHDQPRQHAYSGLLIVGARDREQFDRLLCSPALASTVRVQQQYCTALHAYAVENTYPLVLDSQPQPGPAGLPLTN